MQGEDGYTKELLSQRIDMKYFLDLKDEMMPIFQDRLPKRVTKFLK